MVGLDSRSGRGICGGCAGGGAGGALEPPPVGDEPELLFSADDVAKLVD